MVGKIIFFIIARLWILFSWRLWYLSSWKSWAIAFLCPPFVMTPNFSKHNGMAFPFSATKHEAQKKHIKSMYKFMTEKQNPIQLFLYNPKALSLTEAISVDLPDVHPMRHWFLVDSVDYTSVITQSYFRSTDNLLHRSHTVTPNWCGANFTERPIVNCQTKTLSTKSSCELQEIQINNENRKINVAW